jgi:hypothetical protein
MEVIDMKGWQLVPVEPTDVMVECGDAYDDTYSAYVAMLAAAPAPQKELTPEEIGQDGYPTVDPGMLPPSQEAEPVAWKCDRNCTASYVYDAVSADSAARNGWDVTPLYTHAPSDKLRQAAQDALPMLEEAIELFGGKPEGKELLAALRAALEGK